MDEQQANSLAAIEQRAMLLEQPRRVGRPPGRTNYDGWSAIAQAFKDDKIMWARELAATYRAYKADPSEPNREMLRFWLGLVPFVATLSEDRNQVKERRKERRYRRASKAALERLEKAEGRRQA